MMKSAAGINKWLPPYAVPLTIAFSLTVAVVVSVLSLNAGCFIIFQNLFYIPIIIASLYYKKKGIIFSILASSLYIALILAFTQNPVIILGAVIRAVLFILVAGLIIMTSLKKVYIDELKESEARYRDLFDNMSSGVAVYEASGNGENFIFSDFNRAAEKIENIRKEDVIGHSVLEIFPGVKDFNLFDTFKRVWKTGIPEKHPVSYYKDNRITGWRDNYVYKISSGEIVSVYDDVTEKIKTKEAIKESQAKYQEILENMQDAYFRANQEGLLIMVNPAAARIFGYDSPEEMIGIRAISLYYRPEDRTKILDLLKEQEKVEDYITEGKRKDGSRFWVSMNVQYIQNAKEDPDGTEGFIRDITDRKKTEKALLAEEEKYRSLVENISDVILTLDLNGKITYISPVVEKLYGYTQEEVTGEFFSKFIHPEDVERVIEGFQQRLKGEYDYDLFRVIAADGSSHYVRTTLTPNMKNGHLAGFNYVMADYSKIRKVEDTLRGVNKKLNMLSSITRHDILNAITAIRAYIELSKDLVDNPELKKYLEQENRVVNEIQRQIEFTRYYEDIGVYEPKWQDVGIIADETADQLIPTDIAFENSLRGIEIFADPLIERVFYNLIENSLRHGEHVNAIGFSCSKTENGIIISYYDNGVGIDEEEKKKLFKKGYGKNTGLGLFLSSEILAITEITITENGEPGKGVNFDIIVPSKNYRYST